MFCIQICPIYIDWTFILKKVIVGEAEVMHQTNIKIGNFVVNFVCLLSSY